MQVVVFALFIASIILNMFIWNFIVDIDQISFF